MTEKLATTGKIPLARKVLLGLAAFFIVALGGIAVWTTTCPCNQMPGFMLLGDVQKAPVTDWSFVKKLQVYGEAPNNPTPPPDAKRPKGWGTFQLRSAVG